MRLGQRLLSELPNQGDGTNPASFIYGALTVEPKHDQDRIPIQQSLKRKSKHWLQDIYLEDIHGTRRPSIITTTFTCSIYIYIHTYIRINSFAHYLSKHSLNHTSYLVSHSTPSDYFRHVHSRDKLKRGPTAAANNNNNIHRRSVGR